VRKIKPILLSILVAVLLAIGYTYLQKDHSVSAPRSTTSRSNSTEATDQHNLHTPGTASDSINLIVNKKRPLPIQTYAPADLIQPDIAVRVPGNESMQVRKILVDDLYKMFAAAGKDGAPLRLSSGYRSYEYQVALYQEWVQKSGKEAADKVSARPGYSEHQTGLALDIEPLDKTCEIDQCFANTSAGKWLQNNAHNYGFIIRYPDSKEYITGYTYEPWHIRYIGKDLATSFKNSSKSTLEEYYGLTPAPTY
jgi:zinc D-Ala-D-Ala carboxypeptidase